MFDPIFIFQKSSKVGLTCHGDIGAPAVFEDKAGRYRIAGVLAGSIRSCEKSPDIFTRLNDLSRKYNMNRNLASHGSIF